MIVMLVFLVFPEFTKLLQQRQLLDGQLNENKSLLDELNLLGADNKVIQFILINKFVNTINKLGL